MTTWFRALSGLLGASACTLVSEPWSYTDIALDAELDRFAAGCSACLASRCKEPYDACEASDACLDYAACMADNPSPAGRFQCGLVENPAYTRLTSCLGCDVCRFGENWDCVGRYSFEPVGTSVRWTQRLVDSADAGGRRPLAGLTVRGCRRPGLACGPKLSATPDPELEADLVAWTETDADGWFMLELPTEAGSDGFDGVLVVSGAGIPTYRIQQTNPLVTAQSETELFSDVALALVLVLAGLPASDPTHANVLFQVQDCMLKPAQGVTAAATLGEAPLILYAEGRQGELPNTSGTTEAGRGVGGLFSLDPGPGILALEFRRGEAMINKAVVALVAGEVSLLQVGPGSSTRIERW